MAELSAVADCGYLCSAGLWLFFLYPRQLDRRLNGAVNSEAR